MKLAINLFKMNKIRESYNDSWRTAVIWSVAILIYISIFAGKFTFARFLYEESSHGGWGEIRLWALLLATVVIFFQVSILYVKRKKLSFSTDISIVALSIIIVQVGLILHAIWRGNPNQLMLVVWELLSLSAACLLIVFGVALYGSRLVKAILLTGMAVALFFASLALIGVGNQNLYGPGWAPLGTPISFYRLEFFGAFGGLYMLQSATRMRVKILFFCVACCCLVAAFCSLSKAALVAVIITLTMVSAIYIIWFRPIKGVLIFAALVMSFAIFIPFKGVVIKARVSEGILAQGYVVQFNDVLQNQIKLALADKAIDYDSPALDQREESPKKNIEHDIRLQLESQARILNLMMCSAKLGSGCEIAPTKAEAVFLDAFKSTSVILPDLSFRIRLAAEGLYGVSQSIWFGNGIGNYKLIASNLYTRMPEIYTYPHNLPIELLHTVGVVGTAFIVFMIFVIIWAVFHRGSAVASALPIVGFSMAITICSFFAGDYFDFRLFWVGMLMASVLTQDFVPTKPTGRLNRE